MKPLNLIRKLIRFFAGVFFWLHALMIVTMPQPSLNALSSRIGLNPSETILISFFVSMAILSNYGFRRFLIDMLYIYAFPFILLYLLTGLAFKIFRHIPRLMSKFTPTTGQADWITILKLFAPSVSLPTTIDVRPPPQLQSAKSTIAQQAPSAKKGGSTWWRSFWNNVKLPFTSFTVMWCMLIALTDKRVLVITALGILVIHTLRFLLRLAGLAAGANRLLSGAEKRLFAYLESLIDKIMKVPPDKLADQDIAQAVTMLLAYRTCSFILLKRAEVTYLITIVGCFVYFVVYLRLALLFAFIYLAVARLQHIPLTFLDSMVNSIGLPFSYTFFPHSWIIQSIQLVHVLILVTLGVGAVNAYLQRKLSAFRDVAETVWAKLDQEEIKDRINQFHNRTSQGATASKTTA